MIDLMVFTQTSDHVTMCDLNVGLVLDLHGSNLMLGWY